MTNTKFRLVATLSGVDREMQCERTLSLTKIYNDEKCNVKITKFLLKKTVSPGQGAQLVGASSSHTPKGRRFNSKSGSIPRLQVQSMGGVRAGGN